VLIGAAAHFECRNEYRHYGGDHIIFIGHIERYDYTHKPTLLFCGGKYMRPDTSRTRRPRLTKSRRGGAFRLPPMAAHGAIRIALG
jgi:flavin reductase (DIM6/NTAB) family NADH-FMN oxidoreductase RutF